MSSMARPLASTSAGDANGICTRPTSTNRSSWARLNRFKRARDVPTVTPQSYHTFRSSGLARGGQSWVDCAARDAVVRCGTRLSPNQLRAVVDAVRRDGYVQLRGVLDA